MKEYVNVNAAALAELVRMREVRSVELVELVDAARGRIEQLNPVLNAVVRTMPEGERVFETLSRAAAFAAFRQIANATRQPAMSVPLMRNDGGLPVGVHFVGRFGGESTLFRLAAQLEHACPWAARIRTVRT